MTRKVLVHVGPQKTGTTTLQTDVFPVLDGINYIGRKHRQHGIDRLFTDICKYCFSKEHDQSLRAELQERLACISFEVPLVISEEWFSTDYDGLYKGNGCKWQDKITRLSTLLSNYEVVWIITRRDPVDALFSVFCQNELRYKKLQYGSFDNFYKYVNDAKVYNIQYFENFLSDLGVGSVEFIDFDVLRDDAEHFNARLGDILGVPVRSNYSKHNSNKQYGNGVVKLTISNSVAEFMKKLSSMMPYRILHTLKKHTGLKMKTFYNILGTKRLIETPTERQIAEIKKMYL
jgi:hypothetical protein